MNVLNLSNAKISINDFISECSNPLLHHSFDHSLNIIDKLKSVHPEVHDNLLIAGLIVFTFNSHKLEFIKFTEKYELKLPEFTKYLLKELINIFPYFINYNTSLLKKIVSHTCIYTLLLMKYFTINPAPLNQINSSISKIKVIRKDTSLLIDKSVVVKIIDKRLNQLLTSK